MKEVRYFYVPEAGVYFFSKQHSFKEKPHFSNKKNTRTSYSG